MAGGAYRSVPLQVVEDKVRAVWEGQLFMLLPYDDTILMTCQAKCLGTLSCSGNGAWLAMWGHSLPPITMPWIVIICSQYA